MKKKTVKIIVAFATLILGIGIYGGVISICNRLLREHNLASPPTKFLLVLLLFVGMFFAYRAFCRRLDKIGKE